MVVASWPLFAEPLAVYTGNTAPTAYTNWMRWIPDETPLTVLSVPGTHDTMARFGGGIAETQSMTLYEQLRAGIRTIDIRARHIEDRFEIYHGPIHQNASFSDVLIACNTFLAQNPTETILLWLSDASTPGEKDCTRTYRETFLWYRDQSPYGQRIYKGANFSNYAVPLGTVRGKIVIIADFPGDDGYCPTCGFRGSGVYQNHSGEVLTAFEIPAKWIATIEQGLVTAAGSPANMYENSLSGGGGGVWPIDLANGLPGYEGMNYRYIKYLFTGNQHRTTGLLYMDFPGAGIIAAIIAHNMKFATNLSMLAPDFSKMVADVSFTVSAEGDDGAADHAVQVRNFLKHILPSHHWTVLASGAFGIEMGYSLEPDGLFTQAVTAEGYMDVAVSSRTLNAAITSAEVAAYLTPTLVTSLSGSAFTRAAGLRNMLRARFPQARWNTAVKRAPFDAGNWSAQLAAAASASVSVLDDGAFYLYTAWATTASNRPPVVAVDGPEVVHEGDTVIFNAGQSSDPEGDALQFRWDLDGDGTWDTEYSPESSITHTYPNDGQRSAFVEVFDGASARSQKISVSVLNVTPVLDVSGYVALGPDRKLAKDVAIVDPGSDTWRVEILYGDGTPRISTNLASRPFRIEHQYSGPGSFAVQIEIRDDGDTITSSTFHVVTDVPRLQIEPTGLGAFQLSWPNHPAAFRLESCESLVDSAWQGVSGEPEVAGSRKVLNVSGTKTNALFRLVLP